MHEKGEHWPAHYQKIAWEYNLVVCGMLEIDGHVYRDGDLFAVPPKKVVQPSFLTRCEVVCVKVPSLPHDKVLVED